MNIGIPIFLHKVKEYVGLALFLSMCIIALFSFDEYGISWDEQTQRKTGVVNYEYIFTDSKFLFEWKDRDYGVAFELPLIIIEKALSIKDTRSIYLTRHILTHIFFLLGAFFGFKLIDYIYNNKLLATIGFLMIVLHPRIYAHSFFNTKDIPFMAMFMICLYLSVKAFHTKSIVNFIVLGICTGILINLRIMGIMLPFILLIFLVLDAYKEREHLYFWKLALVFIGTTIITTYIFWPFLWTNPIDHFWNAMTNMARFRFARTVLFNGEQILASNINWYYFPVWFCVTTPILYLITGFSSIILLIVHFFKTPLIYLSNSDQRNNLLFLICFFSPVIVVIILNSVLYDGWRQLFFIYPAFVMISIYGLNYLLMRRRIWVIAGSLVTFGSASIFMIKDRPFQHVYFNRFLTLSAPEKIRKSFELDYWGTSYKQALEFILSSDRSDSINIHVANVPGQYNAMILPSIQRQRLRFVPLEKATYFITNYRWHPEDYSEFKGLEYHSIKVHNNTINEIFKIR